MKWKYNKSGPRVVKTYLMQEREKCVASVPKRLQRFVKKNVMQHSGKHGPVTTCLKHVACNDSGEQHKRTPVHHVNRIQPSLKLLVTPMFDKCKSPTTHTFEFWSIKPSNTYPQKTLFLQVRLQAINYLHKSERLCRAGSQKSWWAGGVVAVSWIERVKPSCGNSCQSTDETPLQSLEKVNHTACKLSVTQSHTRPSKWEGNTMHKHAQLRYNRDCNASI